VNTEARVIDRVTPGSGVRKHFRVYRKSLSRH